MTDFTLERINRLTDKVDDQSDELSTLKNMIITQQVSQNAQTAIMNAHFETLIGMFSGVIKRCQTANNGGRKNGAK